MMLLYEAQPAGANAPTLHVLGVQALKSVQGGEWSQQEVLALLQGIAQFGDRWDQVASTVGSKTQASLAGSRSSSACKEQSG